MADGLASHLGDIGSESIIDGGISNADLAAGQVSGTVLATGCVINRYISAGQISGTTIASGCIINRYMATDACSGLVVQSAFPTLTLGSPATVGNCIQAGTGTLSSGSIKWQVFQTAFKASPVVLVQNTKTADAPIYVVAGSINTGSFYCVGKTASDTFAYMAIGSGRAP